MIKKLILGLILLALVAVGAIYFFGASALNNGVKRGVETFGPQVTQTAVTLDSVNLSPFSGSGTLKGLHVANPEGFKSENIFALGQIDIKIDKSTVFSDKIVIDEVIIKRPEISYEKTLSSSNVKQLLANIEAFTGPQDDSEADGGAKKQVVIRKLLIEEGTVYVGAMGIGQTVKLPRIEMTDIGEDNNRMTIAEAVNLVLSTVVSNIGPAIANVGELGQAAAEAIKTQGLEKMDQVTEQAGKAGKAAEDIGKKAGDAAGDAVNKATDSVKSLFGN